MPQCPTCGKNLDVGVRYCPEDGTPLTATAVGTAVHTPAPARQPPSREICLPALVGSRYELLEVRGGGGMAKVYRAIDRTLEREVAVKVINPELRSDPEFDMRFQREARIASQLADPHIVVVHDFGLDPELGPFLVMEYLQGESLRERLHREGPLPLKAGLQLSAQLMLALIHAHEKGIVHRDIKPDNVFLLNQSGVRLHLRVLDFGIARIYRRDEPEHAATLTRPGSVVGTPRYMSPEQLAGQPLDARSDLYSAAMVVHEALTAQLPYVSGKKLSELSPQAPQALQDLLDHCLKPNPAERPPNAVEVYLRLQELGKASGILLLPPGAMDKLLKARKDRPEAVTGEQAADAPTVVLRRNWLWGLLAAGATIAASGTVGVIWWLRPGPTDTGRESVLSLAIEDSRQRVLDRLGEPERQSTGNPWAGEEKDLLGHIVKPEDLGDPNALTTLQVSWWQQNQVCAIFREGRLLALVVHEPHAGQSGRGVRLNDRASKLEQLYGELRPEMDTYDLPATSTRRRRHGKVYRYQQRGIGFEVEDDRVTSIALYPPRLKQN